MCCVPTLPGSRRRASSAERRVLVEDGTLEAPELLTRLDAKLVDERAARLLILLCVPALPLPTGGATHVFEVIAVLLALQLMAGRAQVWLPLRWRRLDLSGGKRERFVLALIRLIRRLEGVSRPRWPFLFEHRLSNLIFGALVAVGSTAAFLAPPFSGLDTLPALGVVLLSLGVLLEDVLVVIAALLIGAIGIAIEVALGRAVIHGIESLL